MNLYIITYDIADNKRRTKVFNYLRRWGNHLQFSVFRCELSERQLAELAADLKEKIHHDDDQILVFDLGPSEGRARESVLALGATYTHPERHALIL